MFSVSNLSVAFNGIDLFTSISFMVGEKDRIGLVGKNGVGKSTFLKVISKEMDPSEGKVLIPDEKTIGYLPQEVSVFRKLSVENNILAVLEFSIKDKKERLLYNYVTFKELRKASTAWIKDNQSCLRECERYDELEE